MGTVKWSKADGGADCWDGGKQSAAADGNALVRESGLLQERSTGAIIVPSETDVPRSSPSWSARV